MIFAAIALTIAVLLFTVLVRAKDLPVQAEDSPFQHLDERKVAIYENLRDLQFEYRVGKLSDADYQRTKLELQKELAVVMAEIDRKKLEMGIARPAPAPKPAKTEVTATVCPHCAAKFPQPLKFCGECGKPMVKEGA